MKKTYYICGRISAPTRTEEIVNLYKFYRKEQELNAMGHKAFNPAKYEVPGGDWNFYLARDLDWIMRHKKRLVMYVMENAGESKGLALELAMAKRLNIPIFYEEELDKPIKYKLEEK